MMRFRCRGLVGLLLTLGVLHLSATPYGTTVTGTNCKITLTCPFDDPPTEGAIPFAVEIENDSEQQGTWHIDFNVDGARESFVNASYEFKVEPHATNKFSIAVPLALRNSYSWMSIRPTIYGPGTNDSFPTTTINHGGVPCIISNSLKLDLRALNTERETRSKVAFLGTFVAPVDLPENWMGLSGVGSLLLSDTDWLGLKAEQRQAVLDYVAMGGRLGIFVEGQTAARPDSLGLPVDVSGSLPLYPNYAYRLGTGYIGLEDKKDFSESPMEFLIQTAVRPSLADSAHTYVDTTWPIGDAVGKVVVNAPLIVLIVILFSTLVGPINLIYFAPANKRIRLFLTTPIISLGASALLLIGILVVDGMGGKGRQAVVIYSLPKLHQELVIQEQASRTAVLLSNTWKNVDDALTLEIPTIAQNAGGGNPEVEMDERFREGGPDMSGSWFKSRSVSWQFLRAIRPTRSCLTITNLKEVKAGKQPPKLISSFPDTLTEVHVSVGSKFWVAHSLAPGQPVACTEETSDSREAYFDDCQAHVGKWLKDAIQKPETGADPSSFTGFTANPFFIATAEPDDRQVIHSLNAIKWQIDLQIYVGDMVDQQDEATHDH